MLVLGIESSCDETGVALYDPALGLLSNALHSQVDLHAGFGGVVPELASRDHMRRLLPLVRHVLREAGREPAALDAVAYTAGPGLAGALLTGAAFARGLAYALGIPAVAIHHMEGHLLAPMLAPDPPRFPFVSLLVSGGHTMLVEARALGHYRVLGESLDDAAGEAFDKTAKLLGLGYPGGPALARLAETGRPGRFRLPRPMLDRAGLDFSFSGLKTAVALVAVQVAEDPVARADLAREFEEAVVETLVEKCRRALLQVGLERLVVAGGVSANRRLRSALEALSGEIGVRVYFPRLDLCTDNGAMVAYAGAMRFGDARLRPLAFAPRVRWELATLRPPDGDRAGAP